MDVIVAVDPAGKTASAAQLPGNSKFGYQHLMSTVELHPEGQSSRRVGLSDEKQPTDLRLTAAIGTHAGDSAFGFVIGGVFVPTPFGSGVGHSIYPQPPKEHLGFDVSTSRNRGR